MPRVACKTTKRKGDNKNKNNENEIFNEEENIEFAEPLPEGFEDENLLEMEILPLPEPLMNADGSGQRLIISHIEVENFKSYFGRQTIGPFHQNFTAIIGPNGSGKSNVIDSLLFVFGYRASKIRSKKISVLIHSSAGREHINSCTVSVYFQKIVIINGKMETVEGSNFFVSRTAYRDNSSRYTLNGRTTQFRDIAVVLRECGIDLIHNRFLILQGEVEHISLMKSKAQNEHEEGMLEYLEDIIGSSRLKVPINKLIHKLARIQEQRANQFVRLRQTENEKLALENSAKTVVIKLRIENAIAYAQTKIYELKKLTMSDQLDELMPAYEEQLVLVEEAQKELGELKANSKSLKGEHKQLQRDLEIKQEASTSLSASVGTKNQALTKMENDKKRLLTQREKINTNIEKETAKIAEFEGVPERATERLRNYKIELAETEEVIRNNAAEIDAKLHIVQERTKALTATRQKLDAELGEHIMDDDKCAADLALAQEMLSSLQREEVAQQRILAEHRDRLAQMENEFATKSGNLQTTQHNLPLLERELHDIQKEESALCVAERDLDEKSRNLRVELEQGRQNIAQFQSTNRLLNALMDQKKNGVIKGIYGRLGDLGAIDAKYDVAISTTCGALDNIVVDNVETAQKCIEFLKRENLGIASFIALNKQQHFWPYIREKPPTPDNAPRLFDLVKVNDKDILPAFYFALRNTLVAPEIQSATQIAMRNGKRWRTVTLNGEVVELTGAMTGGGNAQQRGRIGQEVRVNTSQAAGRSEKDLVALSNTLKNVEAELLELRSKLTRLRQNQRDRQADYTRSSQLVKNLSADVEMLQTNITSFKQQIEDQSEKVKNLVVDPVVLKEHSDKIDQLTKESDKYSKKSDILRLRLCDLTEKINAIENEIIGSFQRALREAEERKCTTEKAIAKEQNAIASNKRNLKDAHKRKTDFESDLEQANDNLADLEQKIDAARSELQEMADCLTECRAAVVDAEAAYSAAVERSRELNSGEVAVEKRLTNEQEKAAQIRGRAEQLRNKISVIETHISKLKFYNLKKLDGLPANLLECCKDDMLLADSLSVTDNLQANEEQELIDEDAEVMDVEENNGEGLDSFAEQESNADNSNLIHEFNGRAKKKNQHLAGNVKIPTIRMPRFDAETLQNFDEDALKDQLKELESRKVDEMQKDINANLGLLMDYIQKAIHFDEEFRDFQRISKERDDHRELCERLRKQRLQEFMDGFQLINERLKEMYQMITLGGDASLDLVDSLDPFSEGVSFGVRPPKKSWKQIINLSGGEKTLASLALIFSLHHYRPTPFYVMDEIDAALDYRNVSILAYLIKEKTENAQFIIISLRNNLFEKCNRIVGICKVDDCTRHVVFDNDLKQCESAML